MAPLDPTHLADDAYEVGQLLCLLPSLGIPHFQRGLVWSSDAISRLLESLFFGTPCGTVILWRPAEPECAGVPLLGEGDPTLFIVDGQQRMRSLHRIFGDAPRDRPLGERQWCLNIEALPMLRATYLGAVRADALFVHRKIRRSDGSVLNNLIPFDILRAWPGGSLFVWDHLSAPDKSVNLVQTLVEQLPARVEAMMRQKLFVVTKAEEGLGRHDLAGMVDLYNRINSSGSPVRAEERAFAGMISVNPATQHTLQAFFDSVHAGASRSDGLDRDAVLTRRRERAFGFETFVRAFVVVVAFHMSRSAGSQSRGFHFQLLENRWVLHRLKQLDEQRSFMPMVEDVRTMLAAVRKVLDEWLFVDDLRFLPSTEVLLPAFATWIRFAKPAAEVGVDLSPLMALQMLMTLVGGDEAHGMRQHQSILAADDLEEVIEKARTLTVDGALETRLRQANHPNHALVLLLYWMTRRHGARDLSYRNRGGEMPGLEPGTEVVVCSAVHPEKQHNVPFSCLQRLYADDDVKRSSSHKANNVANILYISRKLNGLAGLSDRAVDLRLESVANLKAHLMLAPSAVDVGGDFLAAYDDVVGKGTGEERRAAYERYLRLRRGLYRSDLQSWVDHLHSEMPDVGRVLPSPARIDATRRDTIRAMDIAPELVDALVDFDRRSGLSPTSRVRVGWSLEWVHKERRALALRVSVRPTHLAIEAGKSRFPDAWVWLGARADRHAVDPVADWKTVRLAFADGTATAVELLGAFTSWFASRP